jgi:hypothetical protein
MRWISILGILVLGGCVPYPIYKTLQPELEITVINDQTEPIHGAKVILISSSHPYGWEKNRETKTTDRMGVATFQKRSEWRVESLMIHGGEIFFWNWCVDKEGFVTYETQNTNSGIPKSKILIELEPGISKECTVHKEQL